ncbi:hypothetical protein ACGFJT_41785 [Actinomadura geliboluensis]|uniref:hypothetical protein n=1 Tax=Actinomadura geliboluensis TaxID=882440 RepID=UPI0037249EE6
MGDAQPPALGAVERERLRHLHTQIRASGNDEWLDQVGPMFADQLRRELPDLNDATIGRVALAVASLVQDHAQRQQAAALLSLWGTITTAGLVLTRPEWDPDWEAGPS